MDGIDNSDTERRRRITMNENHPDTVPLHLLTSAIRFRGDVSVLRNIPESDYLLIKSYELRNGQNPRIVLLEIIISWV